MKVKQNDQEYNRYVEAVTPKHSCFSNCLHAFGSEDVYACLVRFYTIFFLSNFIMKRQMP